MASQSKGAGRPQDDIPSRAEIMAAMPEFRAPQRARLILDTTEDGEPMHSAQDGWAQIDGPWLHWYDDQFDHWQSWPMDHVLCIDWEPAARAQEETNRG